MQRSAVFCLQEGCLDHLVIKVQPGSNWQKVAHKVVGKGRGLVYEGLYMLQLVFVLVRGVGEVGRSFCCGRWSGRVREMLFQHLGRDLSSQQQTALRHS